MKKVKLKEARGITLVALVITVIILLILAGVAISLVIGENGLITKSKQAVEKSEIESIKEQAQMVRGELEIGRFGKEKEEITKSRLINALNVGFEDSIVEGSRVIVKNKKYAIFVKADLEIEVIKNDGKTLADGELKLDYSVTEYGVIEIYPRIGGVKNYKHYAEEILEGKTQEEKEQIFVEGDTYWYPEDYEGIENPTIQDTLDSWGYETIEELVANERYNSFDEFLIAESLVKPEGFDWENYRYSEIEITCPNGEVLYTDTETLCVRYQAYKNEEYKFTAEADNGAIAEITVQIPEEILKSLSMKLKIKIEEGNETIQLPVYQYTDENYAYDCEVDWGDGSQKQNITNENLSSATHTYVPGIYTITVEGVYESLYGNTSIEKSLIKVSQWGSTGLKAVYLSYCENLTEIATPSKNSFVNVTDFDWTFNGCKSLQSIPERLFANCPNVTSFFDTFAGCSSLTGKAIELWKEGREGINENSGGAGCYADCIGLENYEQIPEYWRNRLPQ